jgi:hypothetical protein
MLLFFLAMLAVKGSAIFNHRYCPFNKFIKQNAQPQNIL